MCFKKRRKGDNGLDILKQFHDYSKLNIYLLCGGWSSLRHTNINTYSFIYNCLNL